MKYLIAVGLALMPVLVAAGSETCLYKSDSVDGLNRICVYNCPSGDAVMTVRANKLCPLRWVRE